MYNKNNPNYKKYLAGMISENEYYDSFEPKVNEVSDDGNDMLKRNLKDIQEYSSMMLDLLTSEDQLEEWMESKVAVCRAYISDVAHAFKHDKEEASEEGHCGMSPDEDMPNWEGSEIEEM